MGSNAAAALALVALAGLVWFFTRPVQSGTQINAVAGLRG